MSLEYKLTRIELLASAKRLQETASKLEGLKNIEWIRGNTDSSIMKWSPESTEAFHDARAARHEHKAIVEGLAWYLAQDLEYY